MFIVTFKPLGIHDDNPNSFLKCLDTVTRLTFHPAENASAFLFFTGTSCRTHSCSPYDMVTTRSYYSWSIWSFLYSIYTIFVILHHAIMYSSPPYIYFHIGCLKRRIPVLLPKRSYKKIKAALLAAGRNVSLIAIPRHLSKEFGLSSGIESSLNVIINIELSNFVNGCKT